jgi:hypothetical protein
MVYIVPQGDGAMVAADDSIQALDVPPDGTPASLPVPYSVHYGFYDYTRQYLEDFQTFIVAQNLESKLGALKEVGPYEAPSEPKISITKHSPVRPTTSVAAVGSTLSIACGADHFRGPQPGWRHEHPIRRFLRREVGRPCIQIQIHNYNIMARAGEASNPSSSLT